MKNEIGLIIPSSESIYLFKKIGVRVVNNPIEIKDWNRLIRFATTGLAESNRAEDFELAQSLCSNYIRLGVSIESLL
jgi:hypothetical protein